MNVRGLGSLFYGGPWSLPPTKTLYLWNSHVGREVAGVKGGEEGPVANLGAHLSWNFLSTLQALRFGWKSGGINDMFLLIPLILRY